MFWKRVLFSRLCGFGNGLSVAAMLVASGEARRRPSIHRPHETAAGKQTNHTLNISIDLKASHFNSCELWNKMVQVFYITLEHLLISSENISSKQFLLKNKIQICFIFTFNILFWNIIKPMSFKFDNCLWVSQKDNNIQ